MTNRQRQVANVEVDQSGRFEDTRVDTVLALANGIRYAIRIPAQIKRTCLKVLRQRGKKGAALYLSLFSAALLLLLRPWGQQLGIVTIDIEYEGHEAEIKARLLRLAWRHGLRLSSGQLTFRLIGKQSRAHQTALGVFRGQRLADVTIKAQDLLRLAK